MTVHNSEIAQLFARLADLLEIEDANPFRVRAYRNAARVIDGLGHGLAEMLAQGEDLTELPGIGEDLAQKIAEIVETGKLALLEEVGARTPEALSTLMEIEGLGPKRVKALYKELKVKSLADLQQAVERGAIRALPGFGEKTEAHIQAGLARVQVAGQRIQLHAAEEIAEGLVTYLEALDGVKEVEVAGSYRRRRETVGDLDILVTARKGTAVTDHFVKYGEVGEVVAHGTTRATVHLRAGLQVDLRVVPQASYGAALHYFTGSKAHNIAVRTLGVKKGLKINEYGVFKGERRIAGRSEQEVYQQVGLPYIEPVLREDRGEIEAAQKGRLPALITVGDIRGDLHCHTQATDGHDTLEAMAAAAKERGYAYLAITDHSQAVRVAHGLDKKRLLAQLEAIDTLNERLDGITLLKGCEVDILKDGTLDLPDTVLEELDLTVCAVHSHFKLPAKQQTERILRAMDNPHFSILAHPSGRLIGEREAYLVDMERLIAGAKERGCHLEVNAQPQRLDLTDLHCMIAKELGVKLAISTDAHGIAQLDYLRYGIDQARRGWIEANDVINTRPLGALRKLLKRR